MKIERDDLSSPAVCELLTEHLRSMQALSPPESVHALDLDELRRPEVTLVTAWDEGELLGCGAIKELDGRHGEIKSMRTAARYMRKGVGRAILSHLIAEGRRRNYARLSLETGSQPEFDAARRLYEQFGFGYCPPFADYREDPYSVYMTLEL